MKASINGPNRRKNRTGDKTLVADFDASSRKAGNDEAEHSGIYFKVRSLEKFVSKNDSFSGSIGDACMFTVNRKRENDSGCRLLKVHFDQSEFIRSTILHIFKYVKVK